MTALVLLLAFLVLSRLAAQPRTTPPPPSPGSAPHHRPAPPQRPAVTRLNAWGLAASPPPASPQDPAITADLFPLEVYPASPAPLPQLPF